MSDEQGETSKTKDAPESEPAAAESEPPASETEPAANQPEPEVIPETAPIVVSEPPPTEPEPEKPAPEPEPPAEAQPEAKPDAEAETKPEAEAAAKPDAEEAAKPEAEAETKPEAEAAAKPEAEEAAKPETEATAKPAAEEAAKPEAEAEAEAEAAAKPESEEAAKPEAEEAAKPEAEQASKPEAEGAAKPEAEAASEVTPEPDKMTEPPTEAPPVAASALNENEILAEQFENYLRIAQAIMKTLKRPKDVEICSKLLRKVQRLNDSKFLEVKRNNNAFFRYCLKVLKWTSDNQPIGLYECWYPDKGYAETPSESRTWLEDNKSYVALKVLQGGANLIYAAVAEDPSAGWHDGGLNVLAKKGACEKPKK